MIFHWSLSENKSPQVSRTLLGILADLNNVVIWIVSTRPLISMSSSPFIDPLVIVSRAPTTIFFTSCEFFTPLLADGLFTGVSSSFQNSSQYSGRSVVLMVLICPLISNSFILLSKPLRTFPSAPVLIGITVSLMFHCFLWQGPSTCLCFRFI